MVRALIESVLGEWGRSLLYFYDEYSLVINLLVVIYGMWIVFSWVNLKRIRQTIVLSIAEQLSKRPEIKSAPLTKKQLESLSIPWESAVQQSRFPFVARQMAFYPRRISVEQVKALLPLNDLADEALDMNKKQARQAA